MCPVCLAAAAVIAAKTTGTGSLTALVAATFRKKKADEQLSESISKPISKKEYRDGHEHN